MAGYEAWKAIYAKSDKKFDSVVATDDGLAIGALKYANVKGLKVPDDIGIAGYNNSQLSVGCEPELTSVDNHLEKMCNDTVDYMLRVLQGDTGMPNQKEMYDRFLNMKLKN